MNYYKDGKRLLATIKTLNFPEITQEEYETEMAAISKRMEVLTAIVEAHRPFTESEILAMLIPKHINTLEVDDNTALRMVGFYPEWAAGQDYTTGFKVQHGGKLWRCLQANTSQTGWEPENAPALWTEICENHAGTMDDPIPYSGNMALESGKYYIQEYVIYLCNRDTGNPVYNTLAELVGIYVEIAA